MRPLRLIAAPGLSSALVLAGALWAVPASAADEAAIFVTGGDVFRLSALSNLTMTESEELQIAPLVGSLGSYSVRVYDAVEDALGRPLLRGASGCLPNSGATAQLVCTFPAQPTQVTVNFNTVQGDTTVVLMQGTPLSMYFLGGSGRDYVQGASGNDKLLGVGGHDRLYGGPGDDLIEGGSGDDYLEGEEGRDDMRGGLGSNSIDAADGIADFVVDCGGVPALLDYDTTLDKPTNCGANPTPIPPAPVEPTDPPAPGTGSGTVDGVPTQVVLTSTGTDNKGTSVAAPQNQIFMNTGLWFGAAGTPPVPTFPPLTNSFPVWMSGLFPGSVLDLSIWSTPSPPDPRSAATRASMRSTAISTTTFTVNAEGVAEGNVPVPAGQRPGNFTLQANAVASSGAAATINVGVVLTETTPDPDPGPDETISISSAARGKGKKESTITVTGTTTGLAGTAVTPRYRIRGAKSWSTGKPVTVTEAGTFTWSLIASKKVRIVVVSGAIKSEPVQVAAVRR